MSVPGCSAELQPSSQCLEDASAREGVLVLVQQRDGLKILRVGHSTLQSYPRGGKLRLFCRKTVGHHSIRDKVLKCSVIMTFIRTRKTMS